jgi:hypothetical protein
MRMTGYTRQQTPAGHPGALSTVAPGRGLCGDLYSIHHAGVPYIGYGFS